MTKEALKRALEALEDENSLSKMKTARDILRKALAQPTTGDYALGYAEGFNDACKKPEQTYSKGDIDRAYHAGLVT